MTDELNERKITETLSGVLMPGSDRSLVDAGAVSGIVIKDGHIGFTIEIDPKDKDNSMTLFVLRSPAFTANTSNVSTQFINHRRYTMRDIGTIEKRVENIEYYTALSLLEQNTISKQDLTILDSANLPRFKNGIVVDSFDGHAVADVAKVDYLASIDTLEKELRPSFNITSITLEFDSIITLKSGPSFTTKAIPACTLILSKSEMENSLVTGFPAFFTQSSEIPQPERIRTKTNSIYFFIII